MNRERLQRLKRILNVEHTFGFSMAAWFCGEQGENFEVVPRDGTTKWADIEPRNFCGTSACALGTAALDPQFRREGLRLSAHLDSSGRVGAVAVTYRGRADFDAAEAFFGLSSRDAHELFGPSGLRAPQVVAKIDALLARS